MKQNILKLGIKNYPIIFTIVCAISIVAACKKNDAPDVANERIILNNIEIKATSTLPVLIGTDTLLKFNVFPIDASNKKIAWSSSNTGVATVDENGKVKAIASGEATITATSTDGGARVASILIRAISSVTKITDITFTNVPAAIFQGETLTLVPTIAPSAATYTTLKYESTNVAVATVSETGVVTAVAKGNVDITISSTDGGMVSVKLPLTINEVIPATGLQITPLSESLGTGEVKTLGLTVVPSNATVAALNWTSSNTAVATVDQNGVVTTIAGGESTITVANKAGVKGTVKVVVEEGKINDVFLTSSPWKAVTTGSTGLIANNRFKVTMAPGSKYRGDFQRTGGATVHAGNYPIIAFKFNRPLSDAGNIIFDTNNGSFLNGNNKLTTVTGVDGVSVQYADLSTGTFGATSIKLSTTAATKLSIFQLKVADFVITPAQLAQGGNTYEVYWVKSFKSVAELLAYISKP
jgi:uncharacterized protein YjdB